MQTAHFTGATGGVSPVIGALMMVATTAVGVGTYVVGLGATLTETAPQASFWR